jgi:uncharacterized protein DUF4342
MGREAEGTGGQALAAKIEQLIHEGNVRRIVVRNDKGRTVLDLPVAVGVVGVLMAPMIAGVGSVVALAGGWSIDVERTDPDPPDTPAS